MSMMTIGFVLLLPTQHTRTPESVTRGHPTLADPLPHEEKQQEQEAQKNNVTKKNLRIGSPNFFRPLCLSK